MAFSPSQQKKWDLAYLHWRREFSTFLREYGYLTREQIEQRQRWLWLQQWKREQR